MLALELTTPYAAPMKNKRLQLRADTIRILETSDLRRVAAGFQTAATAGDTGCPSEATGCHTGWTACGTC